MDVKKKKKIEIIIRAKKNKDRKRDSKKYDEYEFYKVNIERDADPLTSVSLCCPLLNSMLYCSSSFMAHLGSSIFVTNPSIRKQDDEKHVGDDFGDVIESVACVKGACWVDLSSETQQKWRSIPTPNHPPISAFVNPYVNLCGRLYHLGCGLQLEVYDPNYAKWIRLLPPPPPAQLDIGSSTFEWCAPVADPWNHRILLLNQKQNIPSYAFHPESSEYDVGGPIWERLSTNFSYEYRQCVYVDGVFYYTVGSGDLIHAYDMYNNKYLNVVWSTPCHECTIISESSVLLYLGNRLLCLADSTCAPSANESGEPSWKWSSTRINFVILSFKRSSSDSSLVTFTPLYRRYYDLPDIGSIVDYLPLVDEMDDQAVVEDDMSEAQTEPSLMATHIRLQFLAEKLYALRPEVRNELDRDTVDHHLDVLCHHFEDYISVVGKGSLLFK